MQKDRDRWRQSDLHKQAQAHELKNRFARYLGHKARPSVGSRKTSETKRAPVVRWFAVGVLAMWLAWKVFGR